MAGYLPRLIHDVTMVDDLLILFHKFDEVLPGTQMSALADPQNK